MDEERNRQLDLGLSALLSSMTGETPGEGASVAPEGTSNGTPEGIIDEYPFLAQAGQWNRLIALTESHLNVAPDELEPRIWWVRAHLGALSMPASFLAAPLDALIRRSRDSSLPERVRAILKETCELTLERLRQVGDREHFDNLGASMLEAGLRQPIEPEQQRGRRAQSAAVSEHTIVMRHEEAASTSRESSGAAEEQLVSRGVLRTLLVAGGVGSVVLVGAFLVYPNLPSIAADTASASEEFIAMAESRNQMIPALERRDPVGNLSALFYAMNEQQADRIAPQDKQTSTQQSQSPNASQVPPLVPPTERATSNGAIAPAASVGDSAQQAPKTKQPKEKINTTSPVEGPEFRARADRSRGYRPEGDDRLWGDDGRLGPRAPRGGSLGSKSPKGYPVREPEYAPQQPPVGRDIQGGLDMREGRKQTVLVATTVLSEPNYMGEAIAKLRSGDVIEVIGRVGRFLRIRSPRGAIGYVLAQDIEPQGSSR